MYQKSEGSCIKNLKACIKICIKNDISNPVQISPSLSKSVQLKRKVQHVSY